MTGSTAVDSSTAKGRAPKNTVNRAKDIAKRKRRRRRIITLTSVLAAIIVIGGLTVWGLHEATKKPPFATPAHASQHSDGIIAGGRGKVRVDMYVDFQCPACKSLEASAAPVLGKLLATNTITLVYHPMSTLDAKTKTQYSSRAVSSAGCASDYGYFLQYVQVLLANQPAESSGAGLTDDQIVHLGGQAGMIDPHFAQCVRAGKYRAWATHVNQQAAAKHVTMVPTVLVNGKSVAAPGGFPTLPEMQAAITAAK